MSDEQTQVSTEQKKPKNKQYGRNAFIGLVVGVFISNAGNNLASSGQAAGIVLSVIGDILIIAGLFYLIAWIVTSIKKRIDKRK